MPSWDPEQYLRFAEARARPFADLTGRITATDPARVVDLGCGPGNLTRQLAHRWPGSRVTGVDSSTVMIERARVRPPGSDDAVEFVVADIRDFVLPAEVDVLVTNATLQWVPGHLDLLPGWLDALAPGGWLALHVPGNGGAPEHRAIEEVARRPRFAGAAAAALERPLWVEPRQYLDVLSRPDVEVDVWETTYLHVLPGVDPVLEWLRGTGARPVIDALAAQDPALADEYTEQLRQRLRVTHPAGPYGTVFPFRRIFAIAHLTGAVARAEPSGKPLDGGIGV